MRGVDYYELLGVQRDATANEIKSAYRTLARQMHPDAGGTAGTFRLLQEAYETLNDPQRRSAYDGDAGTTTATERPAPPRAPRRRQPRTGRLRDFGDDPTFVPRSPRLRPQDIPWWDTVVPGQKVRHVPWLGPPPWAGLVTLGGWALLLLVSGLVALAVWLWVTLLSVLAVASAVLLFQLYRALRVDRLFVRTVRGRSVFGELDEANDEFPRLLTAKLLSDYLERMPGVRIFHGLAAPGSAEVEFDHAVLCGRRLVLIESKKWLPGHYTMDEESALWRNGHRFRGGSTRLPEIVEQFEEILPEVEIRGAVLLYPSRAGEVSTNSLDGEVVAPITPSLFVCELGDWLAAEPSIVDRDVFTTVLSQVIRE